MYRRTCVVLGFCLLLAACALPKTDTEPQTSSGVGIVEPQPSSRVAPSLDAVQESVLFNGSLHIGAPDAPLTLQIVTNHQCPYCKEFQQNVWPQLKRDFIDTGYVSATVSFLRLRKYPQSALMAKSVACAGKQQKGFAMHQALFEAASFDRAGVVAIASMLRVNDQAFVTCLDDVPLDETLSIAQEKLRTQNISFVPTFILENEVLSGLPTYADMRGRIEQTLADL